MAETIVGNVGTIVSVALKVKEAVETVRQNEKECGDITKLVARISALLKRLEGTEITNDDVMRDVLEDLVENLEEALKIVRECQQRHIIRRFFGAGDMAKELRRVKEDVVWKIMQACFATNIHGTHVQHAGAPPPPPQEQVVTDEGFKEFSLYELKAATNDFSDENIIRRGGSAVIYKGVLRNGLVVAIKKFSDIRKVNRRMFCDEFDIGVKLQHKNIVKVLGYCIKVKLSMSQYEGKYVEVEERQCFLVLRYVPNGSLHNITKGTRRIHWSSCFRMIKGIAECVCYLHEKRVVHMDFKPSNILFDSDMNPVIIDFGSSKVLDHGDDTILVDNVVGTIRYPAPEYIGQGMVSRKCDVFAFGITLRRTICSVCCGRKEWDRMVQEAGGVKGLLDPTLQVDESQVMEIQRCMQVALLCTQRYPEVRPTMADVVKMLNGEKEMPKGLRNSTLPQYTERRDQPRNERRDQPRNERSADNTWLQSGYSSKGSRKKGMPKGLGNSTLSGYSGRRNQPRNEIRADSTRRPREYFSTGLFDPIFYHQNQKLKQTEFSKKQF